MDSNCLLSIYSQSADFSLFFLNYYRMTHVNRKRDKLEHGSTFYDSLEPPEREFALYNRNSSGAQTTSVNSFLIA